MTVWATRADQVDLRGPNPHDLARSPEIPLPLSVVQEREPELTGVFRNANTRPTAIALVTTGKVNLSRLVTGTYRIDQTADALTAGRRDETAVKAVVRPQT